jgi:hypothetical protein
MLSAEFDSSVSIETVEDEIAGEVRCLPTPGQILHMKQGVVGSMIIQAFNLAGVGPVIVADPTKVEIIEFN